MRRVTATTEDACDCGLGCTCTAKVALPDLFAMSCGHDLSAFFLVLCLLLLVVEYEEVFV
jgi:hypothetical protein